jgi:hypothetical protein
MNRNVRLIAGCGEIPRECPRVGLPRQREPIGLVVDLLLRETAVVIVARAEEEDSVHLGSEAGEKRNYSKT